MSWTAFVLFSKEFLYNRKSNHKYRERHKATISHKEFIKMFDI